MIAFVGATSNFKLTSSSMELTPHASTVDGHVMIAIVTVRTPNLTDDAITGPAGWTLVDGIFESGSPGIRTNVYRRVASGEGAPYAWTFAIAGESVGALLTYSGVDTTSPVLVSAIGGQAASSTTRITPDIDITEADCWALSYFVDRSGSTFTGPDTERVEVQVSAASASQVVCDSAGPVATGITSRTATASVSTSVAIQGILALRPAAEPEPPTFTVPQQWTEAGSRDDLQIEASPAEGSWLIVCMSYRMAAGRPPSLGTISDLASNWWLFCGTSTSADDRWQVEVWACPNVQYAPWMLDIVYASVSHIHATDQGCLSETGPRGVDPCPARSHAVPAARTPWTSVVRAAVSHLRSHGRGGWSCSSWAISSASSSGVGAVRTNGRRGCALGSVAQYPGSGRRGSPPRDQKALHRGNCCSKASHASSAPSGQPPRSARTTRFRSRAAGDSVTSWPPRSGWSGAGRAGRGSPAPVRPRQGCRWGCGRRAAPSATGRTPPPSGRGPGHGRAAPGTPGHPMPRGVTSTHPARLDNLSMHVHARAYLCATLHSSLQSAIMEITDGPTPKWVQLAEALRDRIDSGKIPRGEPIPSEYELEEETGLARGTIRKAVKALRDEGRIVTTPGKGSYVA